MMKKRFFSWACCIVALPLILALIACGDKDSEPAAPAVELQLTKSKITINGVAREYYVYAPSNLAALREQDARQVPIVFSFHDQGQTGEDNAKATRWHDVAEANGFVVAFPCAVAGKWNTTQSSAADDDVAFVKAVWTAFQQASGTDAFNLSSGNPVYLTGIGMGAAMAQQMAMIGANLGTIQVISAVAGIRGTADAAIYNLPAGATPAGASLPVSTMVAWIFRDPATYLSSGEVLQRDYWNKQNSVASSPKASSDSSFDTYSYTNVANPLQETRVSTFKTPALSGKDLSLYIWNNMFSKVLRFLDDTRVNGSLHNWESIAEMGLTESSKQFSVAAGGKQRWLIYLPSNYATLTAGGKKIPLVFSLHGRKGSARWQAMMTQWHKVAEKKGFIMVYPQGPEATWNADISKGASTPNTNVQYFLELLDELKSKYAVDTTRVYMNGTSMGALFANRMAVQYPELFAAIAPCYSGHLSADVYLNWSQYPDVKTNVPIPVWMCHGGDEPYSAFPGGAKAQEEARTFWRVTVNKSKATAAATTRRYDDTAPVSTSNPDVTKVWEDTVSPTTKQVIGRKKIDVFTDGLAEFRWQVTDYVPHFWHLSDQAEQMWDEMFFHYVRNADKTLTRN
jgi:poly(3-hydroxybutyrate) depolymerase